MLYQFACTIFSEKPVWRMENVFPESGRVKIAMIGQSDFIETLKYMVLSAYDVRSDSAGLRGILDQDEQSWGDYFDGLRKDYPMRREFSHLTLQVEQTDARLQKAVESLGFHLEMNP